MHELDNITGLIVDSAVRIHRELGPGLLESVYELVLERELVVREPGVTKCLTFDLRQPDRNHAREVRRKRLRDQRLVCKDQPRRSSTSNSLIFKITAEDFDIKPSDLQDHPAEVRDQMA